MFEPAVLLILVWTVRNRGKNKEAVFLVMTTSGKCNINNKRQALLTLLSLLAAGGQVNSAFYNVTTAYMQRS